MNKLEFFDFIRNNIGEIPIIRDHFRDDHHINYGLVSTTIEIKGYSILKVEKAVPYGLRDNSYYIQLFLTRESIWKELMENIFTKGLNFYKL